MRYFALPYTVIDMPMSRFVSKFLASRWPDALLAFALLCVGEFELLGGATYQGVPVWPGPQVVTGLVTVPLLTIPLFWRRTKPMHSFSVIMGVIALLSFVYGGSEAATLFLTALVTIYSAAANVKDPRLVFVIAPAALLAHLVRDPQAHGVVDVVWGIGFGVIAGLFGLAVRGRQSTITDLMTETTRLEAEREAHARMAVAEERARVARELHDVVAHAVSVVVVQSQAGQRLVGVDDERATESLVAIESTARTAMSEMRRLIGILREVDDETQFDPQPGLEDIEGLVARVREAGMTVDFAVTGDPTPLLPGIALSAYRLVQEGLTNALKHAGGATTAVTLHYSNSSLQVEILDSGSDAASQFDSQSGHGLVGMKERVGLFDGVFESGPRPQGGWQLRASFPLES